MKKKIIGCLLVSVGLAVVMLSFKSLPGRSSYKDLYLERLSEWTQKTQRLISLTDSADLTNLTKKESLKQQLNYVRTALKNLDFWTRYLDPISYKQLNGPLPVEWETEVFEKFEKPYQRQGAGFTLAFLQLEENDAPRDSVKQLLLRALTAGKVYRHDSLVEQLDQHHHFYLCNRLFLLNLAAIYTTGFECPDPDRIIPELRTMLAGTQEIYQQFNQSFPDYPLPKDYLQLYEAAVLFANRQNDHFSEFDHYRFLRDFVNPLFTINQELIRSYRVTSRSYVDYSLNKSVTSIFSKHLYTGQTTKGVYLRVQDPQVLAEIENIGRLLFYDPILSGNNRRSCASCHKPEHYFTDTSAAKALHFDGVQRLPRNTPSLLNANYNHLIMQDGVHISLQDQALAVITNTAEMFCAEKDVLIKILSCDEYKQAFKRFLKHTPQYQSLSIEHVSSALTYYYSKFSRHYSPFDEAMNRQAELSSDEQKGFNLFMSKAQCATCHFVPQFNGVKPPYVGSEFEVLGVPADKNFSQLSEDKGRYGVNPAKETLHAFRTGGLRNIERTKPYMHNGIFTTLEEVIDFYDAGGGAGHGLDVPNQTLSSDSLHLSELEKKQLLAFMKSLNETIPFDPVPNRLPSSKIRALNSRIVKGDY